MELDDLVAAVVSGGPDGAFGTADDYRLADFRVPLPRRGEVDPALLRRPQHGALVGVVLDQTSGQPLPGVLVTAESAWILHRRVTVSGAHGSFALPLPAGVYDVRFEVEGYQTSVKQRVVVRSTSASRLEEELRSSLAGCL